jgi:hypothetical protein
MRKAEYNRRVLELFSHFVSLPVAIPRWIWSVLSRCCSTADSRHAKDAIRQSRVRRELRGLSPDHDQSKYQP